MYSTIALQTDRGGEGENMASEDLVSALGLDPPIFGRTTGTAVDEDLDDECDHSSDLPSLQPPMLTVRLFPSGTSSSLDRVVQWTRFGKSKLAKTPHLQVKYLMIGASSEACSYLSSTTLHHTTPQLLGSIILPELSLQGGPVTSLSSGLATCTVWLVGSSLQEAAVIACARQPVHSLRTHDFCKALFRRLQPQR